MELVELGIGRFIEQDSDGNGKVKIAERLVLASLFNYFNNPQIPVNIRTATKYLLEKPLSVPQSAGFGFELAMVHVFWSFFTRPEGAILSDVFNFSFTEKYEDAAGKTRVRDVDLAPEWAHHRARLIGDFCTSSPRGPHIVPPAPTTPLAKRAANHEETLKWFADHAAQRGDESGSPPFLLPDFSCGPDIIFGVELEDPQDPTAPRRYLLLSVSCKRWDPKDYAGGSPRDLGGDVVRHALFTMSPEGFFYTMVRNTMHKSLQQ